MYREALELDRDTYDSWALNSGFGEDYAGTLRAANNLALSSLMNGDFRDALRRDRQTLKRRLSLYSSPGHLLALESGIAVGRDLVEAGRYREAARTMTEVAAHSHDSLGDDARMSLNARLWLGIALRCGGDPKLAATHIDAAASGLTRGFGQDSSDALAARLGRALDLLALGQFTDGRAAAQEVLAAYRERLRPSHPLALICRLNAAAALCLEGDYTAARTQVEPAVDGLTAELGSEHPYTLAANMIRERPRQRRKPGRRRRGRGTGLGRADQGPRAAASGHHAQSRQPAADLAPAGDHRPGRRTSARHRGANGAARSPDTLTSPRPASTIGCSAWSTRCRSEGSGGETIPRSAPVTW